MWRKRKSKSIILLACCVLVLIYIQLYNDNLFLGFYRSIPFNRSSIHFHQYNSSNTQDHKYVQNAGSNPIGTQRLVLNVDCAKIIEGDTSEINKAKNVSINDIRSHILSDTTLLEMTENCAGFRRIRRYMGSDTLSRQEKHFPIAFSILLYKDAGQTERLLRTIYRPNNIYCLHVDLSAGHIVHETVRSLVRCFDNVFISSILEDVLYAGMSRLKADLNCMRDLLASNITWKYFINLPSQQFPLKTNKELVKILQLYNGANDIEGITQPGRMMMTRYKTKFVVHGKTIENTGKKKEDPPHGIKVVKGSAYGVFSREFVDFVINSPIPKDLLKWMEEIKSPDEYFWATLHHNKVVEAPGGYTGMYYCSCEIM